MSKLATEYNFSGQTTSLNSYNSTKLNLGPLMVRSSGVNPLYVGPQPIAVGRPVEASTNIPTIFPWAMTWSPTYDWVFFADNATATTSRRVVFYEYNKISNSWNWKGFVTLSPPYNGAAPGNYTVRGFGMTYTAFTSGTASVSNGQYSVSGYSTGWTSARLADGGRIGFGSTDPTQIGTWYNITTINSNTSITLTTPAVASISGAYVIEELRAVLAMTNSTAANGGLFVAKGLNYSTFATGGTAISSGLNVDNRQLVYWLGDGSASNNAACQVAGGLAIDTPIDDLTQYCYVTNGTTTMRVFKHNLKASLTLALGRSDSGSLTLSTGTTAALTGTATQAQNACLATPNHGPAIGQKSLFFTTSTRIYRCADSGIVSTSTTFLSDTATEVPPGSTTSFAASSVLLQLIYLPSIDRFIVASTSAASQRQYVTQYRTDAGQFDHIFMMDTKQQDQSTADANLTPYPSLDASTFSFGATTTGLVYCTRHSTAAAFGQIYNLPLGAHWTYASTTNNRIITPAIYTPNATKYYNVYCNDASYLGGTEIGMSPEPYRVYARTAGISDNSGSWTAIGFNGDLSSLAGATWIQFMFEFKTIGPSCIPARIHNICVTYEDSNTDVHYQPSTGLTSVANRIFAWRQGIAWGSTIPNMRLRIYNTATEGIVLDDVSVTPTLGTWQYSTNSGLSWNSWDATKEGVGYYIRYTATSLADGLTVRALLTQN